MNNTQQTATTATFAKADGMAGERSLTYGVNRNGKYVVCVNLPAGEDIAPDFHRFDTIEEARSTWSKFVKTWRAAGYIPAAEYWDGLRARLADAC